MFFELYLYEKNDFLNSYMLDVSIVAMIFFSAFFFYYSWKNEQNKRMDLFVSIFCILLAILVLCFLVVPKTLDLPYVFDEESEVAIGELKSISLKERNDSERTVLIIDDSEFSLEGNFMELSEFEGKNIYVYYLPNSKQIMKVLMSYESPL